MAEFVKESDIADEVLRGRVTAEQIAGANEHMNRLAAVYGVLNAVARPLTKRLAVLIACRDCCLSFVGTDPTVAIDGNRQDDVYERKYKLYRQQAEDITKMLTRADFMKETDTDDEGERGAWTRTVKISRA